MTFTIKQALAALGVGIAALSAGQAQAQSIVSSTVTPDSLISAQNALLRSALTAPNAGPAISFGSPVAFGADWGTVGIGVGGATVDSSVRNSNSFDDKVNGAASIVFGLGNSRDAFGLETAVSTYSLRGGFDSGGVALKAHTQLPGASAFAVGVENIGRFGSDVKNTRSSAYAVGTKLIDVGTVPVALNIGAGDGRFNNSRSTTGSDIGIFGSIAVMSPYKALPASIIADYSGQFFNAGISLVPFKRYALVISLGAVNINQRNNQSAQFSGAIGYSVHF